MEGVKPIDIDTGNYNKHLKKNQGIFICPYTCRFNSRGINI